MPKVIIIAGPNGVGKTTFAKEFLPNEAGTLQFVNADMIAAGISPFAPDTAAVSAGRVMIKRLEDLSAEGVDFAIETTLSGTWLKDHIVQWRQLGYFVEMHYLRASDVGLTLRRIHQRVQNGGHNIPEQVAIRRFTRSQRLFESLYKNLVDEWIVYNCGEDGIVLSERKG